MGNQITKDAGYFWRRVQNGSPTECWEWKASRNPTGYGSYIVFIEGKREQRAHRVAFFYATGIAPAEKHVLHKCDNRACCNPDHLYLGTHQQNMDDRWARNKNSIRGAAHPLAKLTETDVVSIRHQYSQGRGLSDLGREFNVSPQAIFAIVRRVTWKDV